MSVCVCVCFGVYRGGLGDGQKLKKVKRNVNGFRGGCGGRVKRKKERNTGRKIEARSL